MTWKSAAVLAAEHPSAIYRRQLADLFALSQLVTTCFLPNGYAAPEQAADLISLTALGHRLSTAAQELIPKAREADLKLALFGVFAFTETLIDLEKTEVDGLLALVSDEVRSQRIKYPFTFQRELYERLFKLTGGRQTWAIGPEDTERLLSDASQGVFQMGRFITGPYGILASSSPRFLPPSMRPPLSHCPDPGCQSVHSVKLTTFPTEAGRLYELVWGRLAKAEGAPSEWFRFWRWLIEPPSTFNVDFNFSSLPVLIGNCFSVAELGTLLKLALRENANELRPLLPTVLTGSAEDISVNRTAAEALQLLLLLPDRAIMRLLERAVDTASIDVPVTEVRRSPYGHVQAGGSYKQLPELSRLGIRFVSQRYNLSVLRLRRLLFLLHAGSDGREELEWQLLDTPGASLEEKVESLLHAEVPRELVTRFVVGRRSSYNIALDYLDHGWFPPPTSPEQRDRIVDRLLWKLGFKVARYPTLYPRFREQCSSLRTVVEYGPTHTDARKQEIRSSAVNVFTSLEEILEESLAFAVWALLYDHWTDSRRRRFRFNLSDARRFVADILSGRYVGSEPLVIEATGRNSLFALGAGFTAAAELSAERLGDDKEAYRRPSSDYPGWFVPAGGLQLFPFHHTVPILDLDRDAAEAACSALREVQRRLDRGLVLSVRNRISHGGPNFPTQEEFRTAMSAIESTVGFLEDSGLAPLVSVSSGSTTDEWGRGVGVLRDYRGIEHRVSHSSGLRRCGLPSPSESQIVCRLARVAGTGEVLRFVLEEASEFVQLWRDYPRRPAPDATASVLGTDERPEVPAPSLVDEFQDGV